MSGHDKLPYWFAADKAPGQFSRRHQTDKANTAARERYQSEHGPAARRRRAAERLACTLGRYHRDHVCTGGGS